MVKGLVLESVGPGHHIMIEVLVESIITRNDPTSDAISRDSSAYANEPSPALSSSRSLVQKVMANNVQSQAVHGRTE